MSKQTPSQKLAIVQAQLDALRAVSLSQEEAHNLIALLNRVQVTGVKEASVLAIIAHKLSVLKGDYKGAISGEDTPPAA